MGTSVRPRADVSLDGPDDGGGVVLAVGSGQRLQLYGVPEGRPRPRATEGRHLGTIWRHLKKGLVGSRRSGRWCWVSSERPTQRSVCNETRAKETSHMPSDNASCSLPKANRYPLKPPPQSPYPHPHFL